MTNQSPKKDKQPYIPSAKVTAIREAAQQRPEELVAQARRQDPLTKREAAELDRCEKEISAGLQTFIKVGLALAKIREKRLYRTTHTTFERYVRDTWNLSSSRAYQLVDAADVALRISSTNVDVPAPTNEAQVRPLAGMAPEKAAQVWEEANRDGRKVTGKLVSATAKRLDEGKQPNLPCSQPVPEEPSQKIIGHIRRAEETLAKAIATNLHEEELADLDRAIKNINDRYAHKLAMIEHTHKLIANNQDD